MRIGVLTSGGDSPGMNAAIRAVVRQTIASGHEAIGFYEGFQGLIDNSFRRLESGDVGGIIDRGGTILRTSRCKSFLKESVQKDVVKRLSDDGIGGLVIIGGDGSFRGGEALNRRGAHTVGVPASIDNDLWGTDFSIGFDTALNTVIENLSKIRDTASALERVFVVEVMGRQSGAIALHSGLAGGADYIILPGNSFSNNGDGIALTAEKAGSTSINIDGICNAIGVGFERGKSHYLVVVAEGAGSAFDVGKEIRRCGGYDVKITVLGHIQRGGSPSAQDRLAASVLGARAVEVLIAGDSGVMVGLTANNVQLVPLRETFSHKPKPETELLELVKTLAI